MLDATDCRVREREPGRERTLITNLQMSLSFNSKSGEVQEDGWNLMSSGGRSNHGWRSQSSGENTHPVIPARNSNSNKVNKVNKE